MIAPIIVPSDRIPEPFVGQINMKTENDFYRVEIDASTGGVRGLFDKTAKVELISEPRLAQSFRLLLPLADLEAN